MKKLLKILLSSIFKSFFLTPEELAMIFKSFEVVQSSGEVLALGRGMRGAQKIYED